MKKTKLEIEYFLGNKLDNQNMIIGGGERTKLELILTDEGPVRGGSTVSTGNGGGDMPPNDDILPLEIFN
jgi:hypothetical protein